MIRQVNLDMDEYRGLSTDTKPTGLANGTIFLEIDTGAKYMYDAENDEWCIMPSGGGGGGGGDNTEVISARTGADGTKYGSLKGRLDAENTKLKDEIAAIAPGLTDDAKAALLDCFDHVAWTDDHGREYYDELYDALYDLSPDRYITVTYTQGGTVYSTDSINSLKFDLVVTYYADPHSAEVVVPSTDYTLSGTLTSGTSTITVIYLNTTNTFNVTVTADYASITADYTQSGTVYDTDPLNDLKSNLVVTYFAHVYSAGVTVASADYTLLGTLEAGTSTVTAMYNGLSDTFNVTVTVQTRITAVYTPSGTVYTDDSLSDLKADLVVTYYSNDYPAGSVLSGNDYTLSGTLAAGDDTITVTYNALTTTFIVTEVVDYNSSTWVYNPNGTSNIRQLKRSSFNKKIDDVDRGIFVPSGDSNTRRCHYLDRGVAPFIIENTTTPYDAYPIPVPSSATTCTITVPSGFTVTGAIYKYVNDPSLTTYHYNRIKRNEAQGSLTLSFTADSDLYYAHTVRKTDNSEIYTDPTVTIVFE